MKSMVKAFSDYARAPLPELQPLDLNHVVSGVIELYQDIKDVQFALQLSGQGVRIMGDDGLLRQLLHNLIKNALEATRRAGGKTVTIKTIVPPGEDAMCSLLVEDEGEGLADDVIAHVFEPYFTTKTKGSGLGLAIAKKIVEEHHGTIMAENRGELGARFIVKFPVHKGEVNPIQTMQKKTPEHSVKTRAKAQ
jgi:nitrogen fixation/metabolism regulation signal transduction histidine kinase